jgi:hypothetical protein
MAAEKGLTNGIYNGILSICSAKEASGEPVEPDAKN